MPQTIHVRPGKVAPVNQDQNADKEVKGRRATAEKSRPIARASSPVFSKAAKRTAEHSQTAPLHRDGPNMGWRLRELRQRRGQSLVELSKVANLDVSYLSRLERDALQHAKPKHETVERVLDALGTTRQEREAVFHIEREPLSPSEIMRQVHLIAGLEEEVPEPVVLMDDRWYVWYLNRSARACLSYSPGEYRRQIGSHALLDLIDPSSPRYSRVPDEERESQFAARALAFKSWCAGQEFDQWYMDLVVRIKEVPWASEIWDNPPASAHQLVIERVDMCVQNPQVGQLHFRVQQNRLLADTRFVLLDWTPLDHGTEEQLAELRTQPEFNYEVVDPDA